MFVHLASQDLVAVDANLHQQGEPRLQADMQQAEFRIEEVEIEGQTLASCIDQTRSFLSRNHFETLTRFNSPHHADQAFSDSLVSGDVLGQCFLAVWPVEIYVPTPGAFGELLSVIGDTLGLLLDEISKVFDPQALIGEKLLHGITPTQREVALKQNTVETRDHTGDVFAILTNEAFHGVLLLTVV